MKANLISGFDDFQRKNGRLKVDGHNKVKGTGNVFAIGDVAFQRQRGYDKGLPMLAPVAVQQGKHLARNLRNRLRQKKTTPFHYRNKGVMATVGRNKAVVELPGSLKFGGVFGWYLWVWVHLWSIIGLRRKIIVLAHWMWSYFTYDKGNRLILNQHIETEDHPLSLEKSISKRTISQNGNQKKRDTIHL